jgi:hypothetical protein
MRHLMTLLAFVCIAFCVSNAQNQTQSTVPSQPQVATTHVQTTDRVVLSSESNTVRVANPNETVAIDGRVLRVSDLLAVLSSDRLLEQRPRIQENQTPAVTQPIPPQSEKH